MSARTDRERLDASREARIEAAKERMRLLQRVLTAFVEGKGTSETARSIVIDGQCISRGTAWKCQVVLGLVTGKQHGKRTGRHSTRRSLDEVRP